MTFVRIMGAGIVVAVMVAAGLAPAASAAPDTGAAWLPTWVDKAGTDALTANADLFQTVSPLWYDAVTCDRVSVRAGGEDDSSVSG